MLVVWLPANVLIEALLPAEDAARHLQAAAWIELLFGPIVAAALVHALAAILTGERIDVRVALGRGFERAGRLLKARLAAGALVLLGLLALVVPGIVLMVRWALLDPVIVLEEPGIRAGLARSAALSQGRRWQILATGILCALGGLAISSGLDGAAALGGLPAQMAADCIADVVGTVLDVVLFLFYWEACGGRPGGPAVPSGRFGDTG